MSEESKIQVVSGQDPNRTAKHNLKVKISRLKPVDEELTLAQIEDQIRQQYDRIDNANIQIAKANESIDELKALMAEVSKAIG